MCLAVVKCKVQRSKRSVIVDWGSSLREEQGRNKASYCDLRKDHWHFPRIVVCPIVLGGEL